VRRWKLLISEYDFSIEYIKGEDNHIADSQSRLIEKHGGVLELNYLQEVTHKGTGIVAETDSCREAPWGCEPRHFRERPELTKSGAMRTTARVVTEVFAHTVEIEDPTLQEEFHAKWEEVKIPAAQYKNIGRHHNSTIGHHGVDRTLAKLNAPPSAENHKRGTPKPWPQMREHVKNIKTCLACQKMSRLRTPIKTLGFTTASSAPMTGISIDTITGLPPDEDGNECIAVIIDSFSRWVELYACRRLTLKKM